MKEWPGETIIVNGRPRNPKCQGLIEQGNSSVEKMIGALFQEDSTDDFLFGLNGFLLSNVSHYSNWKDRSLQLTFYITRSTEHYHSWNNENITL